MFSNVKSNLAYISKELKGNMAYIGRNKKESVLPLIGMTIGALLFAKGVILLAAILIKPAILVAAGTTLSVMGPVLVGIIAVAALFTWLSVKNITQNKEISEMNAPKIVVDKDGETYLQVPTETLDNIVKNYPNKNAKGEVIKDEFHIGFINKGEELYITGDIKGIINYEFGGKLFLYINSLGVKEDGKCFNLHEDQWLEKLGLDVDSNRALIIELPPRPVVQEPEAEQQGQNSGVKP